MVVGAVHALLVGREHGRHGAARERRPRVRRGRVDLAVLAASAAAPRPADGEDAAVADRHARLVAARDDHLGRARPPRARRVVRARVLAIVAPRHDDVAVGVEGDARAEHVVFGNVSFFRSGYTGLFFLGKCGGRRHPGNKCWRIPLFAVLGKGNTMSGTRHLR